MKFLYIDVEHRKVVALFRNSNEEIIKLNMRELQILAQKERYILNSKILPELKEGSTCPWSIPKRQIPMVEVWSRI